MIVLIHDGDRVLLGSNALWPSDRFSLLAGFVEAGESLESCVQREVFEESGLRVANIRYRSSQPWPFPRSLMLGFEATPATGVDPEALVADPEEIAELRWFTRDELQSEDLAIVLPGHASIARSLLDDWLARGSRVSAETEALLAGLDDEQREVAQTLRGPVSVLAGAGTGKTRTITHRIAHGVMTGAYRPDRVLAVTFTAKAAAELRSRLRLLGAGGVSARTFHSAALSQLGYFWPQIVGGQAPQVLPGKSRTLAQAADAMRLRFDTDTLRDVASEIEWRKLSSLGIEAYAERAHERSLPNGITAEQLLDVMGSYETLKDERRQIDFEDVLIIMTGMLEVEPRVADAGPGTVPLFHGR